MGLLSNSQIGINDIVLAGDGVRFYSLIFIGVLCLTPLLTAAAEWIPAMIAAAEDPAEILNV